MNSIADKTSVAAFIATSLPIARLPGLAELLGRPVAHYRTTKDFSNCAGVLAWGRKPSAVFASTFAERHGLSLLRLEDGFLRSLGFGKKDSPLSIVVDDLGIYYDALLPSRLESLIVQPLTVEQRQRALSLQKAWRSARVSKYNHAREYVGPLPERYVLVADQVVGDVSIHYGLAEQASFEQMLQAALQENPDCTVVLKIHPAVISGRKQGHFSLKTLANIPRVQVIGDDVHPVSLMERAEAIYCVTSQIGFEGLIWGKKVRTFGMPFYAGWGLSEDGITIGRRYPVPLENLVYAALIAYPRYIDPETNQPCTVERLIEWMGLQRRMREHLPVTVDALGFSYYKRPIVRRFFQGSRVFFDRKPTAIPDDSVRVVWGRDIAQRQNLSSPNIMQLEEGFICSVGLGADLIHSLSWVLDKRGIYYDATRSSDLEHILRYSEFDSALLGRAAALRKRLLSEALTKYNVGHTSWRRPNVTDPSRLAPPTVILVPGQAETEASLVLGALGIRSNLELLRAVNQNNPDAYIVYLPHPEDQNQAAISQWCDEVVVDAVMAELLLQVDEVHTITSLIGFEALLREKRVVCYGLPFYAGWGLTDDAFTLERRNRKLTLDELVAGVLILYPTYVSRTSGKFTTPERALDELLEWRENTADLLPWWRKGLLSLLKMEKTVKRSF